MWSLLTIVRLFVRYGTCRIPIRPAVACNNHFLSRYHNRYFIILQIKCSLSYHLSLRDLEEDLYPHFHRLFGMLIKQVDAVVYSGSSKSGVSNAPNPELTGRLFETLSYLIKYVIFGILLHIFCYAIYLFVTPPSIFNF